jgi:outer membrane usher protein
MLETSMKCWLSSIASIAALAALLAPTPVSGAQAAPGDAPPSSAAPAPHSESQSAPSELIVAVRLNGKIVSDSAQLLQPQTGRFFAPAESFNEWRLVRPAKGAMRVAGNEYLPLNDVPGAICQFDPGRQLLSIAVPASSYQMTIVSGARHSSGEASANLGLFVNHDLRFTEVQDSGMGISGVIEAGVSSNAGIFTNQLAVHGTGDSYSATRLTTQFVSEFPDRVAALTIGDDTSASTPWDRPVNYTGVRWASKFSIQPNVEPYVLPSINGTAAVASTIDIYESNVKIMHADVDSGPFAIQNIPAIGAQGDLSMVVTDVMGRQHVVDQSFIFSTQLLPQGTSAYTYEGGFLRNDFGTRSDDYGPWFFAATDSRGITQQLTWDGHAEILQARQTAGTGLDYGWHGVGVMSGGWAFSNDQVYGQGALWYGIFQRQQRRYAFSANVQATTRNFQQLGSTPNQRSTALTSQGQLSFLLSSASSINFGYMNQQNRSLKNFTSANASWNRRVHQTAYLTAGVNYLAGSPRPILASVGLVIPVGARRMATVSSNAGGGAAPVAADVTQQVPVGTGYAYHFHAEAGPGAQDDARVSYQNNSGQYDIEFNLASGHAAFAMEENSALVFADGHLLTSRPITESFGIVDVPGGAGINVYANNHLVARTNASGVALLPELAAYEDNVVRLDDEGVPISLGLDLEEKTLIPKSRSGVCVKFTAVHLTGALLVLQDANQKSLPAGTEIAVAGSKDTYDVAMNGEVFLPQISYPARVKAKLTDGECEVVVEKPQSDEPLPRIGPLVCAAKK